MTKIKYPGKSGFCTAVLVAATLLCAGLYSARACAQEAQIGPDTYAITLHGVDLHPESRRAARITLAQIGDAAMEVCGASSFSLTVVQRSVRDSACWHDSVAAAVARIGDKLLAGAYAQQTAPHV